MRRPARIGPGAARQVVRILRQVPGLPWQRVVGSGGAIKLPGENGAEQRFRLRMEGVTFRGARMYEFLDRLISVAMPRIRAGRSQITSSSSLCILFITATDNFIAKTSIWRASLESSGHRSIYIARARF